MHAEALDFVRRETTGMDPARVVEIGSLYTEYARPVPYSPLREMFPKAKYIGIDVRAGPTVDVVADGATWKPRHAPDLVLCCEVLEHVPPDEQHAILVNAFEMLAPGGRAIITAACEPRPPHTWDGHAGAAGGYWNVTHGVVVGAYYRVFPEQDGLQTVIDRQRGDIYVRVDAPGSVAVSAA